jgi:hypothetical protein
MHRALIATLASIALATGAPATGCGGGQKASPDGRYLFTRHGKIAYNKTLTTHGATAGCRWRIETEPLTGLKKGQKPKVVGSGGIGHKINVAQPDTVKVYLVTRGCGTWS